MSRRGVREERRDWPGALPGALLPVSEVRRCWASASQATTGELRAVLSGRLRASGAGARPMQAPPCTGAEDRRDRTGWAAEGGERGRARTPKRLRRDLREWASETCPSTRDGATPRTASGARGICPSQERRPYRQQDREPRTVVCQSAAWAAGCRQAGMGTGVHRQVRRSSPDLISAGVRNLRRAENESKPLDMFAGVAGVAS